MLGKPPYPNANFSVLAQRDGADDAWALAPLNPKPLRHGWENTLNPRPLHVLRPPGNQKTLLFLLCLFYVGPSLPTVCWLFLLIKGNYY